MSLLLDPILWLRAKLWNWLAGEFAIEMNQRANRYFIDLKKDAEGRSQEHHVFMQEFRSWLRDNEDYNQKHWRKSELR